MKKRVVISAVNINEGGTLTVLIDCLKAAEKALSNDWEIIALVCSKNIIESERIVFFEFPDIKKSWFKRLWIEWFGFKNFFHGQTTDLWISMHDITPRVNAKRQVVYCHNPSPFYKIALREIYQDPKFFLFNVFYIYLYGVFIRRNDWVVVQQEWIREHFQSRFGNVPVLIAHPNINSQCIKIAKHKKNNGKKVFFYPTLPRVFKNVELLLESMKVLERAGIKNLELRITISGSENRYARWLVNKYQDTHGVRFIGRKNMREIHAEYMQASAVLFPSKLETWGLPISEAKFYQKPLLVANERYATETVGEYNQVQFLDPNDPILWAQKMGEIAHETWRPQRTEATKINPPYVEGWTEFWDFVIKDLD